MRCEGWESRLYEILEDARSEPYELGRHDCFRMVCRVVEALTGADRWPQFEGKYATRSQALRLIARYGRGFEAAGDAFFGAPHVPASYAQRGDIVAIRDETGEKHLGVCLGLHSAVLGAEGIRLVPTLTSLCAWKL